MTPVIREARHADLPALLALYAELGARDGAEWAPQHERAWADLASLPNVWVLVAELIGAAVGTLTLALIPNLTRGARPYGVVENVVTGLPFRGQGVGRALLSEAECRARAAGAYKLILMTGMVRAEAREFYESCGYDGMSKVAFEKRWP